MCRLYERGITPVNQSRHSWGGVLLVMKYHTWWSTTGVTRLRHVTCVNKYVTRCLYEGVESSHLWMRHVAHVSKSCHTCVSHTSTSHVAHMNVSRVIYAKTSCHMYEQTCDVSRVWTSRHTCASVASLMGWSTMCGGVPHVWHDWFTCVPRLWHTSDTSHATRHMFV